LNDVWDQLFPVECHRRANLMIERIDLVHVGEVQGIKVKWRDPARGATRCGGSHHPGERVAHSASNRPWAVFCGRAALDRHRYRSCQPQPTASNPAPVKEMDWRTLA
ncbi:MAG: hypothetical protein AB7D30_04990, partial [Lysobacteraceae bacterium]